jgi:hypothetical protein
MATIDQSNLVGKIRDRPISQELSRVLERAADAAGIGVIRVTSGGQPGSTGRRTGSTRHDHGRAADLQLVQNGRTLSFTDQDGSQVEAFVTAAAANGATGIGAGVTYMGPRTLHVGFGTSPQDHSKLVWGAGGRSANAPRWLREAAERGWAHPELGEAHVAPDPATPGRFVIIARGGLNLRKGPGLGFGITKTLEEGTEVNVLAFEGSDGEWARVDVEGDGLIDGHVFAAFLRRADGREADEEVTEPDGEDI